MKLTLFNRIWSLDLRGFKNETSLIEVRHMTTTVQLHGVIVSVDQNLNFCCGHVFRDRRFQSPTGSAEIGTKPAQRFYLVHCDRIRPMISNRSGGVTHFPCRCELRHHN
jgi:hypothetical protein